MPRRSGARWCLREGAVGEELPAHPPGTSAHLPFALSKEGTHWKLGGGRAGQGSPGCASKVTFGQGRKTGGSGH